MNFLGCLHNLSTKSAWHCLSSPPPLRHSQPRPQSLSATVTLTHTHTHTTLYRFPFCVFPVSSVSPSTLSVSSPRCHTPIYLVYMSASAPSFWRPFLLLAVKPCLIPLWTFSSSPIINYFFLLFFSYMSPPPSSPG